MLLLHINLNSYASHEFQFTCATVSERWLDIFVSTNAPQHCVSRLSEWGLVGQLQPTLRGPSLAHARTEGETSDAIAISLGYATPEAVQFALPCQSHPTSISYLLPLLFHHLGVIVLRIAWRLVIWVGGSRIRALSSTSIVTCYVQHLVCFPQVPLPVVI